jgi:hypothetical protein
MEAHIDRDKSLEQRKVIAARDVEMLSYYANSVPHNSALQNRLLRFQAQRAIQLAEYYQ